MWLHDPKTGSKSATLTIACFGTLICLVKLALSGMTIAGIAFGVFNGSEFAMALAALWAPYSIRKYTDKGIPVDSE